MKRIISFSLWGTDERYLRGALENVLIQPEIYPEWICRFFLREDVPKKWEKTLLDNGAEVIVIHPIEKYYKGNWEGLYWRFFPADYAFGNNVERFISRDTDSILNVREKAAVDEWIESGKQFHIMRDNSQHGVPMLGGMWGALGNSLEGIISDIYKYAEFHRKGVDQDFLEKYIWPKIKDKQISHDEYFYNKFEGAKPFPKHGKLPKESPYVGCIIEDAREIIKNGGTPK